MDNFNYYVQTLETYIMFVIKQKMIELTPKLTEKNRAPIALSMGAPTSAVPQFVIDRLKHYLDIPSYHTYSTPRGETYLLNAISNRMKKRFNVELDPKSEVFSLIGSKEGIANLIREIINPTTDEREKEIILIPDPGYASFKEMVKVSGGLSYPMAMNEENNFMPDFDEVLENLIKDGYNPKKIKGLIFNYPNNPLGCCCTKEYKQKCVDFCKKHNIMLIADNAYCEIYFDENDKPDSIFNYKGARDVALEFYSFSKPYAMTGWRLGWVCGAKENISMLGKLKSTIDTGVFKAIQAAGADLLNSDEGEKYIKASNNIFKENIENFIKGLIELGWKDLKLPKATFYLWLKIPKKYKTSVEFADAMLEKSGIVIVPGTAFGEYGEGYFRASITAGASELKEVIARMKQDGHYFE